MPENQKHVPDVLRLLVDVGRAASMTSKMAINVVLGVRVNGVEKVLGLWLEQTDDVSFWLWVTSALRKRI